MGFDGQEPKVVFEVEGDFANAGGGHTLGIFETEAEAKGNAVGCGSCDCGGDGIVNRRLAVPAANGEFYLIESNRTYKIGAMEPSDAKAIHGGETVFDLVLTSIKNKNRIWTTKLLRSYLDVGIATAKRLVDNVPCTLKSQMTEGESRAIRSALLKAGCTCELHLVG